MKNAMDELIEKIKKLDNPTVIGLDPRYDMIPEYITSKYEKTIEGACSAILEFNKALIDATYDIIPAVKPQIAFYEMFGIEGIKVFKETCDYAKKKGMCVIIDAKRGDIGSTAEGYSNAFIGKTPLGDKKESIFDADFVTVNPYLGSDGIKPFIKDCIEYGKGIFIILKTSNPSSGELQNVITENGEEIYKHMAKLINDWGKDLIGENGYSSVSVVVGATHPRELEELRELMPNAFFLIPGYGAQGGKAEDIALGFDKEGIGGIINASRSLMCAYKKYNEFEEKDYAMATRREAIRMRDELNSAIKNK